MQQAAGNYRQPKERIMKKFFFGFLSVTLLFVGSLANAQEGFRGPGPGIVTVDTARGLRDNHPVVLRGRIERFLGDEKYLFTDETGSITVEIDKKLWRGLSVDQNDTVEITGEVDKDFTKVEIEASSIKKI
jgi:uncharacterized protein (TIGR00156 family)